MNMKYASQEHYNEFIRKCDKVNKQDVRHWPRRDEVKFLEHWEVEHDGVHHIHCFIPNGMTVDGKQIAVMLMPWEPFGMAVSKAMDYLDAR